MNDSVKFIFRTLVKVPIIILVSYFIFNIFAFTFTYFRLMGFSYVAMQTAVENNYLPASEQGTLDNYLQTMNSGVVSNLQVYCDTVPNIDADGKLVVDKENSNSRVQYGAPITVGVSCKYKVIFPLITKREVKEADGTKSDKVTSDSLKKNETDNNITIQYTVPGLKYYPDMQ